MDLTWLNALPEPIKAILLGAAGDFLGGMAADVTGRRGRRATRSRNASGLSRSDRCAAMAEALMSPSR